MAPKNQASLFGEIALAMKLLTREQLAECVVAQLRSPTPKRLGDVCREKGYLSSAQIQRILEGQKKLMARRRGSPGGSGTKERRSVKVEERVAAQAVAERKPIPAAEVRRVAAFQRAPAGTLDVEVDLDLTQLPELTGPGPAAATKPEAEPETERQRRPEAVRPPVEEPPPAEERVEAAPHPPRRSPAVGETARIDTLLRAMVDARASDLHLVSGMPPMARIHGKMRKLTDRPAFEHAELQELLFEIATDRAYEAFCSTNDADFAYAIEGVARFRANYFLDRKGIGAVFRFIPFDVLTPEQIGLPPKVLDLCQLSKGLVLVTGPTGSGKSTTLASLIDHINRTRDDHIITIEDPVEFTHENKRCLVNQREVGVHTSSFKSALRAALREDPDIVLVGELRDLETVSIAIETAETGHLVFGTLHTTTAASTVDRIIDQFPTDQQSQIRVMLSGSLRGVIAQVLCVKRGGGRVAAYEILMGTQAVANLIREGKTPQIVSIMQTGRAAGMQTINDHLIELVKTKQIDPQEAYFRAYDKVGLMQSLEAQGIALKAAARA